MLMINEYEYKYKYIDTYAKEISEYIKKYEYK